MILISLVCVWFCFLIYFHFLLLQPQELTRVLIVSNIIITIIFVVEMIIKLIALSWMYFADLDNIFDFVVVLTRYKPLSFDFETLLIVLLCHIRKHFFVSLGVSQV